MEYSGVIIDWSCCQPEIAKKIREKVKERTGVDSGDTAYGGLPILNELGEALKQASRELMREEKCGKENEKRK